MKKAAILLTVLAIAVGAFVFSRAALNRFAAAQPASDIARTRAPLACDTQALTPEVRKRHFGELGPALRSMKKSVRELPDGYEFEFPADAATYAMLTEWAIQEHLCCPFFDISVYLEREHGPLWLRLTGGQGVKEFMGADMTGWLKK